MKESHKQQLTDFVDLIERTKKSKFIIEFPKNDILNIIYSRKHTEKPNEDLLRSFLMDFRKIYMSKEPTNLNKICNLLMNYIDQEEKKELCKFRNNYTELLNISFPAGIPAERPKSVKDILDDWFYGYYFHEEKNKKQDIARLRGMEDLYKWIFIDNLQGIFYCAINLTDLVKRVLNRKFVQ